MVSYNFKWSSKYVSYALFTSCWCNTRFLLHSPIIRTLVRHLQFCKWCTSSHASSSKPKFGCIPSLKLLWRGSVENHLLFADHPSFGYWIVFKVIIICSSRSSIFSPGSNEDFATPNIMGTSFLPFGRIF